MSIEEKSSLLNKHNDLLVINENTKFHGLYQYPFRINLNQDKKVVEFKFFSDWITSQVLQNPKGFLIYFESKLSFKI
jgi:hypothetical protein